jgi:hypothetical protein
MILLLSYIKCLCLAAISDMKLKPDTDSEAAREDNISADLNKIKRQA